MHRMTARMLLVAVAGVGLSFSSVATPVEREPITGTPNDLVLRFETDKQEYALYEPVSVGYSLRNPGPGPIVSKARMRFSDQHLKIFVQFEAEQPVEYLGGLIGDSFRLVDETKHAPRQVMWSRVSLFYNSLTRALAFPRLGRYTVFGRMYVGDDPNPIWIEASPIQVDIVEPSAEDRLVLESLGSGEGLTTILRFSMAEYCKDSDTPSCSESVRLLLDKFPNSSYMPSLTTHLAAYAGLRHGGSNPNYAQKIELLELFLKRWPGHPDASSVVWTLAETFHRAGREREAMRWTEKFERDFPELVSPRSVVMGDD